MKLHFCRAAFALELSSIEVCTSQQPLRATGVQPTSSQLYMPCHISADFTSSAGLRGGVRVCKLVDVNLQPAILCFCPSWGMACNQFNSGSNIAPGCSRFILAASTSISIDVAKIHSVRSILAVILPW